MKHDKLAETVQTALHAQADAYTVPDNMKERIDREIAHSEHRRDSMSRFRVKKAAAAAAVFTVLTGTICFAGAKAAYTVGQSSSIPKYTSFADLGKLEKEVGVKTCAIERFSNGYAFDGLFVTKNQDKDSAGNTVHKYDNIDVSYKKGDNCIRYMITPGQRGLEASEVTQQFDVQGCAYYYTETQNLFVPPGYEPTAEEQKAQDEGRLNIAYGASEVEHKVSRQLTWADGAATHELFAMDVDLSAQELLDMALEMQ